MTTFNTDYNPIIQIDDELNAIAPVVEQVRMLHAKGQHGFDICPQNIVMSPRGAELRVKKIALNPDGASVYRHGFTARERYIGGIVGPWTDVYAVSALVYTAITGLMLPSAFDRKDSEPLFDNLDEKYHALADVVTQGLACEIHARQKSLDALSAQMQACLTGYCPPTAKNGAVMRVDKPRKPLTRKRKTVVVIIAAVLLLGGTALVNEINYSQAAAHAEAGEYLEARKSLKGVFAFYKDASQLISFADAGVKLENSEYDAASSGFSALGDYRDSADMVKETDYLHAQFLMEKGSLAEAAQLLNSIGDYKDASQLLQQISYQNGVTYMDAGLNLSALEAFQDLGGYSDAAARAKDTKDKLFASALDALNVGDTDTAATYLAAIPGYEQADALAKLTQSLARVQSGNAVTQDEYDFIAGFSDAIDLSPYLTSDTLIGYYLRGSWQDDAGNTFELDDSGGITYNIPGDAGDSYVFDGGVLYMGENAVFRFSSIDLNTVELLAYENGETYVLSRK